MATTFKWQAVQEGIISKDDTGSFDITDSNAVIDFIIKRRGMWIVIYHTTV